MIKSSKSGFTLAEVLTTLMVIGVVAAMTIPTLMNSTQNQQAKVACKKAASILGQGMQMLQAQEITCPVTSSETLAGCMKNVLAGTLNGNKILTPDGFTYGFYVNGNASTSAPQDISEVCGPSLTNGMSNCIVAVDTNGKKGTDSTFSVKDSVLTANDAKAIEAGPDVVLFQMSSTSVRPAWYSGNKNYSYDFVTGDTNIAQGTANPYNEKYCCSVAWTACDHQNAAGKTVKYCGGTLQYGTGSCPKDAPTALDDSSVFAKSSSECPEE